ncbi:hypothetical protein A6E13_04615 [Aliivibrio fischeri]|uniref:hypothetical protein n=1 Tax=Aliivibrio fischeri TaxID=668 RepID=UPI00080ED237|nr:hypothetical protein [Aliivibrio fischeri]OCH30489.1 hypothetical protein A6E13_04615 [Aliivibrio fischeri]
MKTEKVLSYLRKLRNEAQDLDLDSEHIHSVLARSKEFIRSHINDDCEFYMSLLYLDDKNPSIKAFVSIMDGFIEYIEEGFLDVYSPLQEAQQNIVSDLLDQARVLLDDRKVHPAASIVLIGATLEEFLRNWVERENIKLGNRKPSISSYSALLLNKSLISKQDSKDILAWGGLRNEAAHGKWDEINNKERAKIMLEGVNLFMRKHGLEVEPAS